MSFKNKIIGLTLLLSLGSGVASSADFNKGVEAYNSGDFKTALAEWKPLAAQGNAVIQYNLGVMYENGEGVPENDKTAVKWLTLAAKQGYAKAQGYLGLMYQNGEGVLENDKTAVEWLTLAAKQGYAKAQYNLGITYFEGEGVLTDNRRAYMWWNLANYNGYKAAGKNKDRIAKQMTPADISKAQDMSSLCLESNYADC